MIRRLFLIISLILANAPVVQAQVSNLITPVTYFVNHIKQLSELKGNLNKYGKTSIVGTSGIGKTQLARMYAYEHKDNYEIVWFIDCNLDINEEFLKLAKKINESFKADIAEDVSLSKKEVIDYLVSRSNWLLIFDNLKIKDNDKILEFANLEHNGNIIFCSQNSELLPNIIAMQAFGTKDTTFLVRSILEEGESDYKISEFLMEEFKGYPILVVQGAQLLKEIKGLNMESYKKKLNQSNDKIQINVELALSYLNESAKKLVQKIALINNQSFSKDILSIITDDKDSLDDDIYQLSKLMLISSIEPSDTNPIFEMHDVIAQKVQEIDKDTKNHLEDILNKLYHSMPKDVVEGHIFRNAVTIPENLEIILKNAIIRKVNIYKIMLLNTALLTDYLNNFDYYRSEKVISWFEENNRAGQFKLLLMNNDEKHAYAYYLGLTGSYYKRKYNNNNKYNEYYLKAKECLSHVKGYESSKCNIYYNLAMSYISLGFLQEAEENIAIIEKMLNEENVNKSNIIFLHRVKSGLFSIEGKTLETLQEIENTIKTFVNNGIDINDLLLTSTYLLKAETLNFIGKYDQAYAQVQQLYNMHKPVKSEDHEIFGRIYTQMAKSELGQGEVKKASDHIDKAIEIFLADELRNPKDVDYPEDTDLAASYVVRGDIFFTQNDLENAIESYRLAHSIYLHLYKTRCKNVAHVSYLYTQGAKAACKKGDLESYQSFGEPQLNEFGIHHPNTVHMLEYCKQYDMVLFPDEN